MTKLIVMCVPMKAKDFVCEYSGKLYNKGIDAEKELDNARRDPDVFSSWIAEVEVNKKGK